MKTVVLFLVLKFHNFRMEEVRAYMDLVMDITSQIPVNQLGETRDDFKEAQDVYSGVLKQVMGSVYTKGVADADDYRDKIGTGLTTVVKGYSYHFDQTVAEAARQLQIVFNATKNFTKLPYSQQTATIKELVENLRSDRYNHLLDDAGIRGWVDELENANNNFEAAYLNRGQEDGVYHVETGTSAEARKNVIAEYNEFIATLNAMLRIKPTQELERAALSLNEITRQYQNTIAQREGVNAAKKKEDEGTEGTEEPLPEKEH